MDVQFTIGSIRANSISNSSAVNIGTNLLIGFGSHTKTTNGNGEYTGDYGAMPANTAYVDDRDWVDFPVWSTSDAPG